MNPEHSSVRRRAASPLSIAVASGKGGVGKTTVAANLALGLTRAGLRVTLLDGDLGLANLDVLLGVIPQRTIEHFFREGVPLAEIAVEGPLGMRVIPAGSGLPELTRLAANQKTLLSLALEELSADTDVLIMDTPAGVGDAMIELAGLADEVLLVTWPEPTALVDAYASLKVLRSRRLDQRIGLVVNGARDEDEAQRVHQRLVAASERFLGSGIELEGFIVEDPAVAESARRQRPVVLAHPLSPASRGFESLALRYAARAGGRMRGAMEASWQPGRSTRDIQH